MWCRSARGKLLNGDALAAEGNYDLAIDYIGETLQHLVYQRLWKRRALNDYKGALEDAWMLHALDDKNTSYCLLVCELLEARCDTVGLRRAYDTFSVKHPELFMRKKRDLQARFRARRVDFVARLPREAAYLIMNQLLSSEKSVCYNVSKIWRSIMTDWSGTWRTLAINDTGRSYLPYHRPVSSRFLLGRPIQPHAVRTLIYKKDEFDDEMSAALRNTLVRLRDLNLSRLKEIHCDFSHRIHRADFAVDLNETPLYLMRDIIYNSARHLTRLCFYDVRLSSSGAWWSDLFDNCPNLTDLSYIFSDSAVQDMRDELILARPTQLMYLRWHANVDLPFNDLLPFCPRLQRLHMDPLTTDTAMLEFFSNIKRWCPSIADLFLTEPMFEDTCPIDPKERLRLRLTVILSRAEPVKEFIVSHASEFSEISILRPENDALGDAFSESFQLEHPGALTFPYVKRLGYFGKLNLCQCQFSSVQALYIDDWDGQTLQHAQRFSELTTLVLLPRSRTRGVLSGYPDFSIQGDIRLTWASLSKIAFYATSMSVIIDLLKCMEVHPMLKHVTWQVRDQFSMKALDELGRVAPNLECLYITGGDAVLTSEILCMFAQRWPFLKKVIVDNVRSVSASGTTWLQNRGITIDVAMTKSDQKQESNSNERNTMLQFMSGADDRILIEPGHFCLFTEFEKK